MAQFSKIEWTHHTFNPWVGCTKVNIACQHCYAEHLVDRRFRWARWGPNGMRTRTSATNWKQPLRWNRDAAAAGEPRRVFCASLADVFEDRPELVAWRRDLFALIDATPNLHWLLLTKRPENVLNMWPGQFRAHVWLGTSVGDQASADKWLPRLRPLRELVPILFASIEPLVGPVDLTKHIDMLDWVIIGGESGPDARECKDEWISAMVRQCKAHRTPVFVKQVGKRKGLKDRKGGDPAEWPKDLRVRQFPKSRARAREVSDK